jgi:rod shape-determining protein MreD
MGRLRLALVLIVALAVQTSVLVRFRPGGVVPDIMILLAVSAGLVGGPDRGALTGFFAGISIDLFLQTPVGLSALVFGLVGYVAGMLAEGAVRATWWMPVLTGLVASAAGEVLFALSGAVVGEAHLLAPRLALIAAVVGIVNAIFTPVMVRVVAWALAERPTALRGAT